MSESDLNRLCKESYYDFSTQNVHETQLDAWKRKGERVWKRSLRHTEGNNPALISNT